MITDMNIVLLDELFDLLIDDYPVESAIQQALKVFAPTDAETWSKAYLACVNAAAMFLQADENDQLKLMRDPGLSSATLNLQFLADDLKLANKHGWL